MPSHYLEFERPIADLEAKIEELSKLSETAGDGGLDPEIEALRARAAECAATPTPGSTLDRRPRSPATPTGRTSSTTPPA